MVRYSILRLLIFFGCLGLLWLLGLRSRDEQLILLLGSALLSLLISYFALRPLREQYSRELAERLERRRAVRAAVNDEQAEDAENEGRADYR
ncbi:MAG TPA: DUF4229 domain-containing protein [Dermatophilaceae bacterium]|nr:DUF4229 domain-containing protein [Dermatophilaceae bacterium]